MRPATAVALLGVVVLLVGGVILAITPGAAGGDLVEYWISDTARDNRVNHHAVGAAPTVVVAPVTPGPNAESLTNTSCAIVALEPESGAVRWRDGVPSDLCFLHSITQPAIADLRDDGDLEVVVATNENALIAYGAMSGSEAFRVSLSTYGFGRPTIGNLTPATGPEVVVADIAGGVVAVTGSGRPIWRYAVDSTTLVAPVVGDLDADGEPEAFVGASTRAVLLSADGTVEWRRDLSVSTRAVADVDGDRSVELFVTHSNRLVAFDAGKARGRMWRRTFDDSVRVRDVADGDGHPEIYAGIAGGRVVAVDAVTGEREWTTKLVAGGERITPAPRVGDVDGDGAPEIVATANDGTVVVLAPSDGAELAAYRRDVPIWTFPTLADLDDDGDVEALIRYGDGRVVALDYRRR